jgi:hypothetical protein
MVAHVFHQTQILQLLPAFVPQDLQIHDVIEQHKMIHVIVVHVKQMVIVHYQHQIQHLHVFVKRIMLVINVKEVKINVF